MRCKDNIEITMKIPIVVDKPDANGHIYKKEAIESSIKHIKQSGNNLPIVFSSLGGDNPLVIGHTNSVEFLDKENSYLINGELYHGGTCEIINHEEATKNGIIITDMSLLSFGVCHED